MKRLLVVLLIGCLLAAVPTVAHGVYIAGPGPGGGDVDSIGVDGFLAGPGPGGGDVDSIGVDGFLAGPGPGGGDVDSTGKA